MERGRICLIPIAIHEAIVLAEYMQKNDGTPLIMVKEIERQDTSISVRDAIIEGKTTYYSDLEDKSELFAIIGSRITNVLDFLQTCVTTEYVPERLSE